MNIMMIACSIKGAETIARLSAAMQKDGQYNISCAYKCSRVCREDMHRIDGALTDYVGENIHIFDAFVFVCACGIAVRAVAPYIKDKTVDPAVVVMDDSGKYVIPILSGHLGGANSLAKSIAKMTGAVPVITTATDCENVFAVDTFARNNQLEISDMKLAKEISAALLAGKKIGYISEFEIEGDIPSQLQKFSSDEMTDYFSDDKIDYLSDDKLSDCSIIDMGYEYVFCILGKNSKTQIQGDRENIIKGTKELNKRVLSLYREPQKYVVGIGCRRDTDYEKISEAFETAISVCNIDKAKIVRIASIDKKKDEKGIQKLARNMNIEFVTFDADCLANQPGTFSDSSFVEDVVGVSNVCTRSAVAGARAGENNLCKKGDFQVILDKLIGNGVTVSIVGIYEKRLSFE